MHVLISCLYLHANVNKLREANRDQIIQKIINTIHLIDATPALNRQHAIHAIYDPKIHTSLSKEPRWPKHFETISLWEINNTLHHHLNNFAISLQLAPHTWLNIHAIHDPKFFISQLLLISIEMIVFGAILFAAWSINRFTRPLERFKQAAERLSDDLYADPVPIYGPLVVQEAAIAMNKMQQKITDLIHDRTTMLAAISHDLRTPITRMKLRSQFISNASLSEKFNADLDEMELMIAQTLNFMKADNRQEEKSTIDLCSLLHALCEQQRDMGHCIQFHSRLKHAPLHARATAIKRAFSNVINNAFKYAKTVDITLRQRPNNIIVTISDDGPGIPPKALKKVFHPFFRHDPSRNRDTGGIGLGLAITRDIIQNHQGSIQLKNRRQGGLQVTVLLHSEH